MKILLCDDDISTVDVIQNQIDWTELGITRILRAYNGNVAKELILKEKPEIVLCDIGMPLCNGVEVLHFIREACPDSQFAFMTCYESFDYAREALRYGAVNYLTKPLDMDEIKESLQKMIQELRRTAAEKAHRDGMASQSAAMRKNFLRMLGDGAFGTSPQKIDEAMRREKVCIDMTASWRQVLVAADMTNAYQAGWSKELARYSFFYLAEEAIAGRMDFDYSLEDRKSHFDRLMLLIPDEKFSKDDLVRRCHRFVQICRSHMAVCPICLISEPDSLYHFADDYAQMQELLRKCRLRTGRVLTVEELRDEAIQDSIPHLNATELLLQVQTRDRAGFEEKIDAFLKQIASSRYSTEQQITMFHHDLVQCFYTLLRDNNIHPHELFRDESLCDLDYYADQSLVDARHYALGLYDHAVLALDAEPENSDAISSVKQYIKDHFRENITRAELANIAFISPNYLSKRFCVEVGMSLREYINQYRVEEAKRLLLSTNKTVSEIACEVGIENISYFSTIFRKCSGTTPVGWRENAGKIEISRE